MYLPYSILFTGLSLTLIHVHVGAPRTSRTSLGEIVRNSQSFEESTQTSHAPDCLLFYPWCSVIVRMAKALDYKCIKVLGSTDLNLYDPVSTEFCVSTYFDVSY